MSKKLIRFQQHLPNIDDKQVREELKRVLENADQEIMNATQSSSKIKTCSNQFAQYVREQLEIL